MAFKNRYYALGLSLLTVLLFTSCKIDKITSHKKSVTLEPIVSYARNGATAPTREDYINAGVTGVDSEEILMELNQIIVGLTAEEVDTTEEIQALVNTLTSDSSAPVITIVGGTNITVALNSTYTDAGATATDDVDGIVTVTSTGTVDTTTVGDYNITYTATDVAGNMATATRRVSVAVVTMITHNGTSYGTVTSPYTGKVWLDRNLGASQVCTSSTDVSCYGDYYQWGRNFDGHQSSTSAVTNILATSLFNAGSSFIASNTEGWIIIDFNGHMRSANWSKTDGTFVCPVGFRVPTLLELREETLHNGVTNSSTALSNFLKLPLAGVRYYDTGDLTNQGVGGYIWSATSVRGGANGIGFNNDSAFATHKVIRSFGIPVRCIKD